MQACSLILMQTSVFQVGRFSVFPAPTFSCFLPSNLSQHVPCSLLWVFIMHQPSPSLSVDECCHEVRALSLEEQCKICQNKILQLRANILGSCLGSCYHAVFKQTSFLFKLNDMRNHNRTPKLMFPLVTNRTPYSCGIFHIKGEVEEG